MLKSMTAYGRACKVTSLGRFVVEIQSVNRKHLEVNTLLPKELVRYDVDIKKIIAQKVGRGQVNVKLSATFDRTSPLVVTPNVALAKQIKAAWDVIADELEVSADKGFHLEMLAREPGILIYDEDVQDDQIFRAAIGSVVCEALEQLMIMKQREGKALSQDICARFDRLLPLIQEIANKASGATDRYRQKLLERLQEVFAASSDMDERLLREVCLFAEKIDITEELIRFQSHLVQVNLLLEKEAGSVGKAFEFLLQELNREINTIGAKSSDIEISRSVLEIKGELERIREQIQNIE